MAGVYEHRPLINYYETNPRSASHLPAPRCADTVGHYLKKM